MGRVNVMRPILPDYSRQVFTQAWPELDLRPHTYRSGRTFTPIGYDGPRTAATGAQRDAPRREPAAARAGRSAEHGEVPSRQQPRSLAPVAVWSREETRRRRRPRSGEDGGSEGASPAERSEAQKHSFDSADFTTV
jgi:hypothetical protein